MQVETRWTRVANISFADAGSVSFSWWSQPGIILRGKDASCSMLSLTPTRSYTATCKTGMPFIVSRRHAANPPKDDTHHWQECCIATVDPGAFANPDDRRHAGWLAGRFDPETPAPRGPARVRWTNLSQRHRRFVSRDGASAVGRRHTNAVIACPGAF